MPINYQIPAVPKNGNLGINPDGTYYNSTNQGDIAINLPPGTSANKGINPKAGILGYYSNTPSTTDTTAQQIRDRLNKYRTANTPSIATATGAPNTWDLSLDTDTKPYTPYSQGTGGQGIGAASFTPYTALANTSSTNNPLNTTDPYEMLNSQYQSSLEAQLKQAELKRQQQELGYNNEKDAINTNYQGVYDQINNAMNLQRQQAIGQRNQVSNAAMQNTQKLREIMASQGLFKSGDNVTEIGRINATRQNNMNDINMQETNALNNFNLQLTQTEREKVQQINALDKQIQLLRNQGSEEDMALVQQLEAQKQGALLRLYQWKQQAAAQAAANELAQKQFEWNALKDILDSNYKLSDMTGNVTGIPIFDTSIIQDRLKQLLGQ